MIVTTYCTAQSLILQLIRIDEMLVLMLGIDMNTCGASGGPVVWQVK